MPERLQRRRTKGYRLPPSAVYVGRPTPYGNPFVIDADLDAKTAVRWYRDNLLAPENANRLARFTRELRGKDLACWCPPDAACHAQVLLDLVNRVDGCEDPAGGYCPQRTPDPFTEESTMTTPDQSSGDTNLKVEAEDVTIETGQSTEAPAEGDGGDSGSDDK